MPGRSRSEQTPPAGTDDVRERILTAAEQRTRYGFRKTTMDDIASEVGLTRPNVYRYFADRDDLLVELNTRHARALFDRAHKSISRQSGLPDQIVESILYIAEQVRRDPDKVLHRPRCHEPGPTNGHFGNDRNARRRTLGSIPRRRHC
jgi:AcrR family transcriptional regulator